MAEADPRSFLEDPLSQISRLERRNLLIASTIGLFVGHVGLVPTKISALGLEFNAPAQRAFLVVVALIATYMVIAFAIYALADFFIWNKLRYDYAVAIEREAQNFSRTDQEEYDELHLAVPRISWYWERSSFVAWLRILLEIALPLIVGFYTALMLWIKIL